MDNNEGIAQTKQVVHNKEISQVLLTDSDLQKAHVTEEIKDLCSNCDYKFNCSLRTVSQYIFQCEHYQ